MIELGRHIEILLLDNDCVIVPDLGGFMAHHVEARYDERDQTFLPPLRTLGFNPQLTMNDSLLVQSYVEAYDLSYPEALRKIEDEVQELKQHLETEGSYELSGIGRLAMNDEGRWSFDPCEAGILTPQLYGLSSFEMKLLDNQESTVISEGPAEDERPVNSVFQTVDDDEDGERAIMIKMSWVRNAVAVAAVVMAFLMMSTPLNTGENSPSIGHLNNVLLPGMTAKDTNMERIDLKRRDTVASVTKHDTARTVATADSILTARADTAKATVQIQSKQETSYCIVLASYVTKQNAAIFVDQLHKKGYDDAEVNVRNNVTRVVCGHFETQGEAYRRLNAVRGDKDFAEAWVMKVEN